MSTSARSTACSVEKCKNTSRSLCYCCNRSLCREHLKEHDELLNSQLCPLADDINSLADELQQINIVQMIAEEKARIDIWRRKEYEKIDQLFQQKCTEMEQRIHTRYEEHKRFVNDLKNSVAKHIHEQDASYEIIDRLNTSIQQARRDLAVLGQRKVEVIITRSDKKPNISKKSITVLSNTDKTDTISMNNFQPKILYTNDESNTRVNPPKVQHFFDISLLPKPYKTSRTSNNGTLAYASSYLKPYKTFGTSNNGTLACNGLHILVNDYGGLHIYDRQLNLKMDGSKLGWNLFISDICYCLSMERFIAVTNDGILFIDDKTMRIEKLDNLPAGIRACTSSEKILYFLYDEDKKSVLEYNIPPIKCVNRWKHPSMTEYGDQILTAYHHNKRLALIVQRQNGYPSSLQLELRDPSTYNQLWILDLSYQSFNQHVSCCPFGTNEWLLTNTRFGQITHISADGQVQSSVSSGFHDVVKVLQIDLSTLAVLKNDSLEFFNIDGCSYVKHE